MPDAAQSLQTKAPSNGVQGAALQTQSAGGALVPPSAANPVGANGTVRTSGRQDVRTQNEIGFVVTPVADPIRARRIEPRQDEKSAVEPAEVPVATSPSTAVSASVGAPAEVELPPLSQTALTFLTSSYYLNNEQALSKDLGLTVDDLTFLNEMDRFVLGGSIPIDGYVRALRQEFPAMAPEQRERLIARLISERFLPWGEELKPSAASVSRTEKLSLPAVPYYAVYVKPLTYSGAASEVARMVGIAQDGPLHERLRDILMSRAKGVRMDTQVEEHLMRPMMQGGLELEQEKARNTVHAIADLLTRARLMTEEEYAEWLAQDTHQKVAAAGTVAAKVRAASPARAASRQDEEDDDAKDIAAIVATMPKPVRDTSSILASSTRAIVGRLSIKPTDAYLTRRLEQIVSTRLRDVRSKMEVLQTFMREIKVGGMGLARADAERVAQELEAGYVEFHAQIMNEERTKSDIQSKEQEQKVADRKKREAEEHARWFQEKIQGKRKEEEAKQQLVQRMRVVAQGFTTPITLPPHALDMKEQAKEKAELGELVDVRDGAKFEGMSRVNARDRKSKMEEEQRVRDARPAVMQGDATVVPTTPANVRVSSETARAAAQEADTNRPRMDDVKVLRTRLSGPLQELGELTLTSFRRLGKTPDIAMARLEQVVDLLSQESFDKRISAIRAWQTSPLQKAYLGIVTEAFMKKMSVSALCEQKRAAGEDGLTAQEITAILGLNAKLHF